MLSTSFTTDQLALNYTDNGKIAEELIYAPTTLTQSV